MKTQMLPMEPLGMLLPTTSNATGTCWTETKFEAARQGPLVMKVACVAKTFYFDLHSDQ